jgi:UDP-glucose 4-epimerase
MKVLLTGGAGYIGSHTVVEMCNAGHDVVVIDNFSNSSMRVMERVEELVGRKIPLYVADVADEEVLDRIFSEHSIDAVVHFAGLKAVGESVQKPLEYYKNNVSGTVNLLECMKETGVKKIIFSSSATVYGVQESPEYVETMKTGGELSNPYGRTKYFIEEILKDV